MVADVNLHEAEVSGVADRVRLVAALPLDDGEGDFKRDALPFRLLPDVPLQLVAHGYVVEELRLQFGLRLFLHVASVTYSVTGAAAVCCARFAAAVVAQE